MCFSTSHIIIIFIKFFLSMWEDLKKPVSLWFRYRCEQQLRHVQFSSLPFLLQRFRWSLFIEKSHNKLFTNESDTQVHPFEHKDALKNWTERAKMIIHKIVTMNNLNYQSYQKMSVAILLKSFRIWTALKLLRGSQSPAQVKRCSKISWWNKRQKKVPQLPYDISGTMSYEVVEPEGW